ncbi:coiled-coil domain-containing protein 50 isoform X7 [Hippocampus zosterae]|uniref:coiled-coil domain-containing protein 50 isoform X7 n=1 Tax=Hippocampus zosterae TaxID=109293 RepID=UPI00223C91B8|nr:coiled-coil domain-containing protein 50 isoform X7 [Hippocampus zosterae]
MAECNVSIDQDKLPGVKEVCRDFAVLEDHCLAYNLQEQEIESHLASNVHKSRLVQQDLQVAKKLQQEEDEIAKVVIKKQHVAIERHDNEIAHEIQDQLVRQAEQQRLQQEEKDAAIARKLHEKEMKEERRRQKHQDEEYYEDPGGRLVHKGSGEFVEGEYGPDEATRDLTKLDLREQELKDLEVARRMHEEEVKASKSHVRAAQVAQDEEIARLLMEQEKREYRKHREREKERERDRHEKERERERERMAMEKRRPEGDYRPNSEDVVRPRSRDEHDPQRHRSHHKPFRPPQPRTHEYENVNPGYGYGDHADSQRAPTRPEAAYKAFELTALSCSSDDREEDVKSPVSVFHSCVSPWQLRCECSCLSSRAHRVETRQVTHPLEVHTPLSYLSLSFTPSRHYVNVLKKLFFVFLGPK